MTLLKMLSPADYVTISNGAVGALGILYFIDGEEKHILAGIALIYIAMFLDGLDGAIARRMGKRHNLGLYLDSMSDAVSFCFAPAIFIYMMFYNIDRGTAFEDIDNFLAVAAAISIAIVGIFRLSIFTFFKEDRLSSFIGLPTPAVAFFTLTGGIIFQDYAIFLLPITIIVVALMLLNIPYPKIRGRLFSLTAIGLLSGFIGAIMGALDQSQYIVPLIISLSLIILYIIAPIIYRLVGKTIESSLDESVEMGSK